MTWDRVLAIADNTTMTPSTLLAATGEVLAAFPAGTIAIATLVLLLFTGLVVVLDSYRMQCRPEGISSYQKTLYWLV